MRNEYCPTIAWLLAGYCQMENWPEQLVGGSACRPEAIRFSALRRKAHLHPRRKKGVPEVKRGQIYQATISN